MPNNQGNPLAEFALAAINAGIEAFRAHFVVHLVYGPSDGEVTCAYPATQAIVRGRGVYLRSDSDQSRFEFEPLAKPETAVAVFGSQCAGGV